MKDLVGVLLILMGALLSASALYSDQHPDRGSMRAGWLLGTISTCAFAGA